LAVGDYLVFYMVNEEEKTVEIHRIFHGSQDVRQHDVYRKLEEGEASIKADSVMDAFESLQTIRKKHG
jgi:hypothetical protein